MAEGTDELKERLHKQFGDLIDGALDLKTTMIGAAQFLVIQLGMARNFIPDPNDLFGVAEFGLACLLLLQGIYARTSK